MLKEVASYEKEAKDNEAKVQKMRDEGKDSYDIRKQEEVGEKPRPRLEYTAYQNAEGWVSKVPGMEGASTPACFVFWVSMFWKAYFSGMASYPPT